MLRRSVSGLLGGIALAAFSPAIAGATTTSFEVKIMLDGAEIPIALPEPESDGSLVVEGWSWGTRDELGNPTSDIITLDLFMDPDPQIIYAISVIDLGTPSTFGFIFSQGIVATTAPGTASHTYSASATDGTAGPSGSMTVTPVAPPSGIPVDSDGTPEVSVYTLSTNGGVTFVNAGLDLGPFLDVGGGSATHGPFNPAPVAGPAGSGSYNVMRVDVNFSLTGGNDAYTFNGEANIVPEPAGLGTLALGLAGLALHVRRRFPH